MSHFSSEIFSFVLFSLIWKESWSLWGPLSLSAATPCTIKLACYSQDESPTGISGDCEVKTPPVPSKSRSRRHNVLETYPVRVTWQFSPYCLLSHQDEPLGFLEKDVELPVRWLILLLWTLYIQKALFATLPRNFEWCSLYRKMWAAKWIVERM